LVENNKYTEGAGPCGGEFKNEVWEEGADASTEAWGAVQEAFTEDWPPLNKGAVAASRRSERNSSV